MQNYRWCMHALRYERAHGYARDVLRWMVDDGWWTMDGGRWMVDDGRAWHPVAAASLFEWTRVAH